MGRKKEEREKGEMYEQAHTVTTTTPYPSSWTIPRGYKNPNDLRDDISRDLLTHYWPHAKLIVGLRHPIEWFQSFYNFRMQHGSQYDDIPSLLLTEEDDDNTTNYLSESINLTAYLDTDQYPCIDDVFHGVCLERSRFHEALAKLGKTPLTSYQEWSLLTPLKQTHGDVHNHTLSSVPRPSTNPLFLYEIHQLQDRPGHASFDFRKDLLHFLGVKGTSPADTSIFPSAYTKSSSQRQLDICLPVYEPLRQVLLHNAIQASLWIRNYLLRSPHVVVSNQTYFEELLQTWMNDPCETHKRW